MVLKYDNHDNEHSHLSLNFSIIFFLTLVVRIFYYVWEFVKKISISLSILFLALSLNLYFMNLAAVEINCLGKALKTIRLKCVKTEKMPVGDISTPTYNSKSKGISNLTSKLVYFLDIWVTMRFGHWPQCCGRDLNPSPLSNIIVLWIFSSFSPHTTPWLGIVKLCHDCKVLRDLN